MRYLSFRCNIPLGITVAGCLIYSLAISASQQAYIEAIKADMGEFSTGSFTPPVNSTWIGSDLASIAEPGKEDDGLESFSHFLKTKSPGTHIFYQRLPPQFQQQVHEEYLVTGDLGRVKKSVFGYLRDLRKR